MVVHLRLNAFIVTLAMLIILRGMLVGATSGRTLFDLPDAFYALMVITFLGLPLAVWLAALAFAGRRRHAALSIGSAARSTRSAAIPKRPAPPASASSASPGASTCWPECSPRLGGLAITGYVGAISANQGNG